MARREMPIPLLNNFGLLPEGVHECEPPEVVASFCANAARATVWGRFEGFLQWAADKPGPVGIYVDGSFVTDKPLPGDIDIALDITDLPPEQQNEWIVAFHREHARVKREFRTDFYPFIRGQEHDFTAFFQYLRVDEAITRGVPDGTRKGILRLVA
jgi:hypothetical protein